MEIKTGIDSVEISRVEHAMETPGFLKKIFSEEEYAYYASKGLKAESIAGAWCAKEAFMKLLGTGFSGLAFDEICVMHNASGKPYYKLRNNAEKLANDKGVKSIDLSVTHDRTKAIAIAVALTE